MSSGPKSHTRMIIDDRSFGAFSLRVKTRGVRLAETHFQRPLIFPDSTEFPSLQILSHGCRVGFVILRLSSFRGERPSNVSGRDFRFENAVASLVSWWWLAAERTANAGGLSWLISTAMAWAWQL